jgi:hypothetical protein
VPIFIGRGAPKTLINRRFRRGLSRSEFFLFDRVRDGVVAVPDMVVENPATASFALKASSYLSANGLMESTRWTNCFCSKAFRG